VPQQQEWRQLLNGRLVGVDKPIVVYGERAHGQAEDATDGDEEEDV